MIKIIKNDALKTFDFGEKEGSPQSKESDLLIHKNIVNNPDKPMYDEGESFNEAFDRTIPVVKDILDREEANTVLVTHNSIFGLIKLWDKLGRPDSFSKEDRIKYTKQDNENGTGSVYEIMGTKGKMYMVRHGETEDNVAKRYRRANVDLTDKGREQAKNAAKEIPMISKAISSPLPRAIETSEILINEIKQTKTTNIMKKPLLNAECIKKFEKSLEWELTHFYMYKLLANKCQMLGYFGAQAYFLAESAEEETHYQKHVDFLNDEGVLAKLPVLAPEKESISCLCDAIQMAYDNELDLLEYYREMYKEEVMEYPEVAAHLSFFLDTQREAVGFYGDILSMFESEKDNDNISMVIDHKLKKLAK